MDAALTSTVVGVVLMAMLATIGWLLKTRIEDIARDVHTVDAKLDDMPSKIFALDARVVRLEAWREYLERENRLGR
jgi:hypothetical protein